MREAARRALELRILTRSLSRVRAIGIDTEAFEVHQADVTRPETLDGFCDGMDAVISCLGASVNPTPQKAAGSFEEIDWLGNKALIQCAKAAGVKKFVYVSMFGAERFPTLAYVRAHERVVAELAASGLDYTIIRPTGFFSAFAEVFEMCRKGRGWLVGGDDAKTNPIHEFDLARVCVDALEADRSEIPVGGPEVLTRRRVFELAFEALGKKPTITRVPGWLVLLGSKLVWLFSRRMAAMLQFYATIGGHDLVAPTSGTRKLGAYYVGLAKERRA